MIRYPGLDRATLTAQVAAKEPDWLTKAAQRTAEMIAAGKFLDRSPIWSDVKPIYMGLQHLKCIYCERPLGGFEAGLVEQDVEHFRPKSSIKAWPKVPAGAASPYDFPTGPQSEMGYYWLAYDLQNYGAACKPCNSARKSNYFPVGGARPAAPMDLAALNAQELPYLIYPVGDLDADPETLIRFDGVLAVPVETSGPAYRRARVTIDFFSLNEREELLKDRFRAIQSVFFQLEVRNTSTNPALKEAARLAIIAAASDAAPQASCVRSYLKLVESNPTKAWEIYQAAEAYLGDHSPP